MKDFNSDFWVLVGTTAPVIALACIVLFGDQLNLSRDVVQAYKATRTRTSFYLAFLWTYAYVINVANITFQAVALFAALISVSQNKNLWSMFYVSIYEGLGLLALLASSGLTVLVKVRFKVSKDVHKPEINMARHMWNLSRKKGSTVIR
jgi:hypothetical protein